MQDSPTRHKSRCCAYTIVNLVLTASTYARLEEKMAPRTNITLLCFALALLSVIEAMDIIRSNERGKSIVSYTHHLIEYSDSVSKRTYFNETFVLLIIDYSPTVFSPLYLNFNSSMRVVELLNAI